MGHLLGITWLEALSIVVATISIYLLMVVLVRLLGQRMLSSFSSYDLAAVIAFGGILARAALGDAPRLAGGAVALLTLVALQAFSGMLRKSAFGARLLVNRPILLVAHGKPLEANLRRCHISHKELHSRLRQAGVASLAQVQAVVFEPSGAFSVIRTGQQLEAELFEEVVGLEELEAAPSVTVRQ